MSSVTYICNWLVVRVMVKVGVRDTVGLTVSVRERTRCYLGGFMSGRACVIQTKRFEK